MRRSRRKRPDLVVLLIWMVLIAATALMAVAVVRPIWDMTAWVA